MISIDDDIEEIKEVVPVVKSKAPVGKENKKVVTDRKQQTGVKPLSVLQRREGFKRRTEMEEYNIMVSFLNNGECKLSHAIRIVISRICLVITPYCQMLEHYLLLIIF